MLRQEENYKSYKQWLKKKMLEDKQQKYQMLMERQELVERDKEEQIRKGIEGQI